MNYIESISLVRTLPCLAEAGKIIVIGKPSRSLNDVLPYLATLPGIIAFNHERCTLTFRRQPGFLTLQSDEVNITQVTDIDEGVELLAALRDSINAVWQHRSELVAVQASRRAPGPFDIWTLLPQTNCRECGEPTCMAFAAGLLQQERSLDECPPLTSDKDFDERRTALAALL